MTKLFIGGAEPDQMLCASCTNKANFKLERKSIVAEKSTAAKKPVTNRKPATKIKPKAKSKATPKPKPKPRPKPKPKLKAVAKPAKQEVSTVVDYDQFRAQIDEVKETCNFLPNMTTTDGYEASKRVSLDVGKLLSALENTRKDLKADSLAFGRLIDGQAKIIAAELIEFQEPHKAAYKKIDTDKKEREEKRIAELEARVRHLRELPQLLQDSDSQGIAQALDGLIKEECLDFFSYTQEALIARNASKDALSIMFTNKMQQEKDAKELAVLRAQQEEKAAVVDTAAIEAAATEREQKAAAEATAAAEQKAADELAAMEAEREKRATNVAHVSKIRGEAKCSLMALGIDEATAKKIVLSINKGDIANVTINY